MHIARDVTTRDADDRARIHSYVSSPVPHTPTLGARVSLSSPLSLPSRPSLVSRAMMTTFCTATRAVTTTTTRRPSTTTSSSARRSVTTTPRATAGDASRDDGRRRRQSAVVSLDRRAFVASAFAAVSMMMIVPGRADALLQPNDEDDEAFLAKAKANRQQRIQSETAKGKKYVNDTGLKLDADGSAVQTAVYKLSKSGSRVASGALDEAAAELNAGDWVRRAVDGATALGASDGLDAFESGVEALKTACAGGDAAAARRAYVDAAKALKRVAEGAGVADKLRLL